MERSNFCREHVREWSNFCMEPLKLRFLWINERILRILSYGISIQHSKEIFIDYIIIRLNTCYNQDGAVFTYSCLFLLQPQPFFQNTSNQNNINSYIPFVSLQLLQICWITKLSRSCVKAIVTNVSLGFIMHFKKQTFFFFQEIITLWA